jgi:hypothetical protein
VSISPFVFLAKMYRCMDVWNYSVEQQKKQGL